MKKLIASIVTLVLICSLAICVVSCKDKGADKDVLIGKWSDANLTYEFFKDGTGKAGVKTFNWGLSSNCPYKTIVNDSTGDFTPTKYYFYFETDNPNAGCRGFDIMTDSEGKQYIHGIGIYGGKSYKLYKVS